MPINSKSDNLSQDFSSKAHKVTDEVIENILKDGKSPGMPQDQADKLLASLYCFALNNEDGYLTAMITPIRYFESHGCCSDQSGPIGQILDKCGEAMESTWEFYDDAIKTPADAANYLMDKGIVWNKDFQDFIDSTLTKELTVWHENHQAVAMKAKEAAQSVKKKTDFKLMLESRVEKPYIFIDMDGVLADFDLHARNHGKYDSNGKVKWDELDEKWWKTMPACDGAKDFYDEVKDMDAGILKFLSAPVPRADSFVGKVEWIQSFLPERGNFALLDLILCPKRDKHCLAAPNRILIDDSEKNIKEWQEAGGIGILHKGDFAETLKELRTVIANIPAQNNSTKPRAGKGKDDPRP